MLLTEHKVCRRRSSLCSLLLLILVFCSHVPTTFADNKSPIVSTDALAPIVQDNVEWFVSQLNGKLSYNATDYNQRFSDEALALIPPDGLDIINVLRTIDNSTWAVTEILVSVPHGAIVRLTPIGADGGEPEFLLNLSVDEEDKIDGLLIQPGEPPKLDDVPTSVEDAAGQLEGMGHSFAYLVADPEQSSESTSCSALSGMGEDEPTPIGSMFKLYVLAAIVDAVEDGTISWDQPVVIVDELKSVPSGITQNDPPGSNRTVRGMAELAISISDNTASDHLMELVGREAVEQVLVDYGHSKPYLNIPFLSTKEWALLKLDGKTFDGEHDTTPGPFGQSYIDAEDNVEERRQILHSLRNISVDGLDLTSWTGPQGGPVAVEEINWFASPIDLCRVLVLLRQSDEASEILSINPGIPDEKGLWSYIGYKGGGEPGVLGMAWYVEAADGSGSRVVTGTVWNYKRAIKDQTEAVLLLGAMRDLSMGVNTHGRTDSSSDVGRNIPCVIVLVLSILAVVGGLQ